ncbi:MhpC Predicted hydrolases or acyltransferases (alpha/beta hydrolase superfamily) [Burkholderiaceae bacterium]
MTISQFPAHFCPLPHTSRHLAYSEVGDVNSTHVLLCLPGLLETRASFDTLLQSAQGVRGLRVISLEYGGRGDSSALPGDQGYAMSVYLADTLAFIKQVVLRDDGMVTRLEVLGISMGGILAMYLAHELGPRVDGLFFNDIGLSLPWMSIYGLYDGMKVQGSLPKPEVLAARLHVTLGAVVSAQSPDHFDLPYRKDWKGMKFGHLLRNFHGPMRLIHGGASGVCPSSQVREMQQAFAQCEVLEVAGAGHPAPFTPAVCQFVLKALSEAPVDAAFTAARQAQADTERGFWPWIKRRYQGATRM